MQLHPHLRPLRGAPRWLPSLLQQEPPLGEGAFSVVWVLQAHSVLKLTSCPVSAAWLATLARQHQGIIGLPLVWQDLGEVAAGPAGRYRGFILQRLFDRPRLAQTGGVRAALWPLYRERFGLQHPPPLCRDGLRQRQRLLQALRAHFPPATSPVVLRQHSLQTAAHCGSQADHPWRQAFDFLERFLRTRPACLDLQQPGNVLFDAYGYPCLADPLASLPEEEALPPASRSLALLGLVPVSRRGLQVLCRWETFAVAADAAALAQYAQRRQALRWQVVAFRGRLHRQCLAQPQQVPYYALPPRQRQRLS